MSNTWGGAREGSGQKHKWRSGDTKAVRIPEKILDDVLSYARLLDNGASARPLLSCDRPESLENVHKVEKLRKLVNDWTRKSSRTSNPKWYHAKRLLNELRDLLEI